MTSTIEIISLVLAVVLLVWLMWDFSPIKCLFIAIINTIYGIFFLKTLSPDTPGLYLVLIIGLFLTIMGLSGFIVWIYSTFKVNPNSNDSSLKGWFSLIRSFDIVLIIGIVFRIFILQPYIVEGSSMEPNFHDKEIMLVDKINYRFRDVSRGDIVIFHAPKNPGDDYIKRVVGLPGETVVIENGKVFINGGIISESYLTQGQQTTNLKSTGFFTQTLGENEYFVLGDNRDNSSDSREWGILPEINIVGRAWYILIPWNSHGFVKHNAAVISETQLLKNIVSFNYYYLKNSS